MVSFPIFDNQIIAQALYFGYNIGEITAPSHYTQYSSSVSFRRSVVYGLGVVWTSIKFFLQKNNLAKFDIFNKNGRKIGI